MRVLRPLAVAMMCVPLLAVGGCSRFRSGGGDAGTSGGGFLKSTLASLVGFEGEIDMSIGMPGLGGSSKITTTLKLKGEKMRMEYGGMLGSAGSVIYDADAKKTYMLMPATHQYTETDLTKLPSSTPSPSTPKPVAKKTGTTDRIAGYECENWVITTPGSPSVSELCVSHGLTFYAMGFGPFASLGSGGEAFGGALDGGGFPLRMRILDASGKETMRMEATRIEKKTEPDSEFEIPAGYTKLGTGTPGGPAYGPHGGGGAPPP